MTIHHGDNLTILPTLPRKSVQTVVTSPPYFGLRDYGLKPSLWPAIEYAPMPGLPNITIPEQSVCLGLETDPLAYVGHLVHVFRLLWDVLRDDGTAWLNLGDGYAGSGKGPPGKTSQLGAVAQAQALNRRSDIDHLKSKDLIGIPWRVAYALQGDGWYLRSDIVWSKNNCMPESVKDRPTKAHEYVFLLSKQERYFYDADAIKEESVSDHGSGNGFKRPARLSFDGRGNDEPWQPTEKRNARTVWNIPTRALAEAHYAPMPEALAERCIRAGSRPGDTILDPFCGTGTTLRVAERLQRIGIGIELSDAYQDIIERRTNGVQLEMV